MSKPTLALWLGTIALFCGCSGQQTTSPATLPGALPAHTPLPIFPKSTRPSVAVPQPQPSVVYVTSAGTVLIYPEAPNQSPIGSISNGINGPWGLWVDQNSNLYVANRGAHDVTEYAPGSVNPTATYSQHVGDALYPIVDRNGDVFVANGDLASGGGTVTEFLAGSTSDYRILQTPGTEVDGMDFDTRGNLYVAYRGASSAPNSSIEELAPGATTGTVLGMSLNQPQGVFVASDGGITVAQTGGTNNLLRFAAGQWTEPKVTTALPQGGDPTQIVATVHEHVIFAASFTNGYVYEIHSPIFKNLVLEEVGEGLDYNNGIALSNGQVF
jgi:hypothetical protein